MNSLSFDAIVVGSGTAASYATEGLVKGGLKVAMIDERPFGGTCALRGCQPKKYLVCNAEAVATAAHLAGRGIETAPQTNWRDLQALKNAFLDDKPEAEIKQWQEMGVTTFQGPALMTAEDEITVSGKSLRARHIVLATGATPRRTEISGAEHTHDSEHFLNLPDLPQRIVFVGGGYISFEFAHVAIRAGARKVTILHRSQQPLKAFDPDIVKTVVEAGQAAGIKLVLNESPASIDSVNRELCITGITGTQYSTDLVIEAIGRMPNLSVLANGGSSGVDVSRRGVVVNAFLQSVSNPNVYAIGDCAASSFMLAPVADEEGKTAAHNILNGNHKKIDYQVVPSAVFTIPNIGAVGCTEAQALYQGFDFRINQGTTTDWPSSIRIGEEHGAYKILIDNHTDQIIGAHLVRHNAAEAINVLALAMRYRLKASDLADFMWAYPTLVSDLKYMVK